VLPNKPRSIPRVDDRRVLNGIFWVLRSGGLPCQTNGSYSFKPNGFGKKLDLIYEFHRQRGLDIRRGRGHRHDAQDYMRWCFADRADANAFEKYFDD
jgi:hypothetical protein